MCVRVCVCVYDMSLWMVCCGCGCEGLMSWQWFTHTPRLPSLDNCKEFKQRRWSSLNSNFIRMKLGLM